MDIRICKECGFILGTRPNSKDYCNYYYNEQYLADLTLRHFSQAFILRNYKEYYQEFQNFQRILEFFFQLALGLDKPSLPVSCVVRERGQKGWGKKSGQKKA